MTVLLVDQALRKTDQIIKRNKKFRSQFSKGHEKQIVFKIEKIINTGERDLDTWHCFIDLLLISNDSKVLERYSLKKIDQFLRSLCKFYPDDIELNLEYYYFLFNVLDNEEKANRYLKNFKARIIKKINKAFE